MHAYDIGGYFGVLLRHANACFPVAIVCGAVAWRLSEIDARLAGAMLLNTKHAPPTAAVDENGQPIYLIIA